jgi:hypothetical protein
VAGLVTTVVGSLNSVPSLTYTLQFFASTACDPSGFGEARRSWLLHRQYERWGDVSFGPGLPTGGVGNQFISATATDPSGNSSEFAACVLAGVSSGFRRRRTP